MDSDGARQELSRRQVLSTAGLAAVAVPLVKLHGAPALIRRPDAVGAPGPQQVHVQFGADAASQVAASWATAAAVSRPRLRLGRDGRGHGDEIPAEGRTYTEALTGETVWTYHARLHGLEPDTHYVYEVVNDGAAPVAGMFRTGPRARSRGFRFTSFGDQAIPAPVGLGLGPNTPNAGYIVPAVESLDPLFHLFNGDLCYANVSDAPVATWASFFTNNARSAANRPWMPAAGNHENEVGNGPQGYLSYQTRFELPDNHSSDFRGNWYAFTVGSIRVISLNNDDVCLQDGAFSAYRRDHIATYVSNGDNPYIMGYSSGEQREFLERELARARLSEDIDWIIVCMHQVSMSSAHFNGADLGIRQQWLPLFDKYGVDLVLTGHEHHFERTFPVRGVLPRRPARKHAAHPGPPGHRPLPDGHLDGRRPHDHRRRRSLDAHAGVGLRRAARRSPDHRCRPRQPAGAAFLDHHDRARAVVGLPGPADPVWLRLVRLRAARAGRNDIDHGDALRCRSGVACLHPAGPVRHAQVARQGPRSR